MITASNGRVMKGVFYADTKTGVVKQYRLKRIGPGIMGGLPRYRKVGVITKKMSFTLRHTVTGREIRSI